MLFAGNQAGVLWQSCGHCTLSSLLSCQEWLYVLAFSTTLAYNSMAVWAHHVFLSNAKHTVGKLNIQYLIYLSLLSEQCWKIFEKAWAIHMALHKWHILEYGRMVRGPILSELLMLLILIFYMLKKHNYCLYICLGNAHFVLLFYLHVWCAVFFVQYIIPCIRYH